MQIRGKITLQYKLRGGEDIFAHGYKRKAIYFLIVFLIVEINFNVNPMIDNLNCIYQDILYLLRSNLVSKLRGFNY